MTAAPTTPTAVVAPVSPPIRTAARRAGFPWVKAIVGVGVVAIWSAVISAVIAVLVSLVLPMRVSEDEEREGLDLASHGERAWELD